MRPRVTVLLTLGLLLAACAGPARKAPYGTYTNPILGGDYPDPSIVRDGEDYYMTHSSFDYNPGLVVWHSTDLVNWEPVSYALQTYLGSVWAPDISKIGDKFYIYFTVHGRGNFVVFADTPYGPWSEPHDLHVGQIDPCPAIGDDGRKWLFLSGGQRIRLTDDGLDTVPGTLEKVWDGWPIPEGWLTEGLAMEGPKIRKVGPWWYFIAAEGGTAGPPTSHLVAIARSGAGTNNIPLKKCCEKGIVVFNAPGANAVAVKEQEIASLVLASRDVLGSIDYVKSIADRGEEIPKLVEKGKSAFTGPELMGKSIGVIGLGAVGALVANAAVSLDMQVWGYDPFMSVDAAWRLSRAVLHASTLDEIYENCDYISINVPHTETTHHMLNEEAFSKMREGVRIINESRAEVVDDEAMTRALESGKVAKYVTDFPNEVILKAPNVIALPHIGACTPESEDRCAVMAAEEMYDYLQNGNIRNSVNLPDVALSRMGVCRLCVIHHNVPRMITSILDFISQKNINVEHMINKPRGGYAVTIVDLSEPIGEDVADAIRRMNDVVRVRVL